MLHCSTIIGEWRWLLSLD